jgi:hypothetical protein
MYILATFIKYIDTVNDVRMKIMVCAVPMEQEIITTITKHGMSLKYSDNQCDQIFATG